MTPVQIFYTYANETDMLNVVLFGKTARQCEVKKNFEKTMNRLLEQIKEEIYQALKKSVRDLIYLPICIPISFQSTSDLHSMISLLNTP